MAARRKTKKVTIPIAPVEREPEWGREVQKRDEARHAADEFNAQPTPTVRLPVRSELPPAHVCTKDGEPLTFVREFNANKRLYSCPTCGGTYVFVDKV